MAHQVQPGRGRDFHTRDRAPRRAELIAHLAGKTGAGTPADENRFATIKSRRFIRRLPVTHLRQRAGRPVMPHPSFRVVPFALADPGPRRDRRHPRQRLLRVAALRMEAHHAVFSLRSGQAPRHAPRHTRPEQFFQRSADGGAGKSFLADGFHCGREHDPTVRAQRLGEFRDGRWIIAPLIKLHVEDDGAGPFGAEIVHEPGVQPGVPKLAATLLQLVVRRFVHRHQDHFGEITLRVESQGGQIKTQPVQAVRERPGPERDSDQGRHQRPAGGRSSQPSPGIAECHVRSRPDGAGPNQKSKVYFSST